MKILISLLMIGLITMNLTAQTEMYCRFEKNGSTYYGKYEDGKIYHLKSAPWTNMEKSGAVYNLSEVKVLYPSEPTKILGLVKAYKQSWEGKTPPKFVRWFIKPPSSAASDYDEIILPDAFDEVKVECELTIIIGKVIQNADESEAESAIFGYTVGNDIMGYDESFVKMTGDTIDYKDPSLAAALKICDHFAPYGPFIYKSAEWRNRNFTLTIENVKTGKKVIYNDNTNNLLYSPSKIVSDLSKVLKLNPGDVILTGTSKSFVASDDDVVTVEIVGFGKLTNKIIRGK